MLRFQHVIALGIVLAATNHCQGQPAQSESLSPSQKKLVSQLTTQWKEYFRGMSTLDIQWKWNGNPFEPQIRHTYNYHFWREPGRYRLDTQFHSQKWAPGNTRNSTSIGERGAVKSLRVTNSGYASLDAPYAIQKGNPYGVVVPTIQIFAWAMDSQSPLTVEEFGSDSLWQKFEQRITSVKAGSWQGRKGWWMTVKEITSGSDLVHNRRTIRCFVDSTTFFPFVTMGKTQYKSKDFSSDGAYEIRVTKTQAWTVNGKKRLLPLDYLSRVWQHNLGTGTRTLKADTWTALAPIKVNTPIDRAKWKLVVPAKALVTYSLRPKPGLNDYRTFYYDPQGGSLWAQQEKERQRQVSSLRRLRALPAIYDEKADGEEQIAQAMKLAATQNKRVLLQFGAYWCPPCHVLHDLLTKDPVLAPLVKDNYISVPIDLNNGHNEAVANRLMGSEQGGLPFLVILDAEGRRVAAPPTEYFAPSQGDKVFDNSKLATFLSRWKPQR